MRAIGIPLNMFTVMFAIGRLPGWIANWKEVREGGEPHLPAAADLHRAARCATTCPLEERLQKVSAAPPGVAKEPVLG